MRSIVTNFFIFPRKKVLGLIQLALYILLLKLAYDIYTSPSAENETPESREVLVVEDGGSISKDPITKLNDENPKINTISNNVIEDSKPNKQSLSDPLLFVSNTKSFKRPIFEHKEKSCGPKVAVLDYYLPWASKNKVYFPFTFILPFGNNFFGDLQCLYFDELDNPIYEGQGFPVTFRQSSEGGFGKEFTNVIALCHAPDTKDYGRIKKVKFTKPECGDQMFAIKSFDANPPSFNMAVCVSPVYSEIIDTTQAGLLEWFEYHRETGVDHFYVYMGLVGPRTKAILYLYQSLGFITLVDWRLFATGKWDQGWYHNQHASLNDCLFRYRSETKYLGFYDIDEFVFGRSGKVHSLSDLLKDWEQQPSYPSQSHLVLLNWFYGSYITPHKKGNSLLISQMINRKESHFDHGREKYILKTDFPIFMVSIHYPDPEFMGSAYRVDTGTAFMAHFQTIHVKLGWDPHTQTTDTEFADMPILDKIEMRVSAMDYLLQLYRRENDLIKEGRNEIE